MAWYNSSWLARKLVTIASSQVDAALTDYPVQVMLNDTDILAGTQPNMQDVLFTAADGTTKLSHELVKRKQVLTCVWSWFSNPRAIYYSGTYARTYVGGVDAAGNLHVSQYTHTTGINEDTVLASSFQLDDHNNPALVVRPSDSKLVAFYTKHNFDTSLYYKVSSNAEDSTAWGSQSTTSYSGTITYANPIILDDDSNACYVFSRVQEGSGDYKWVYKRTTDYSTWGSEVTFWNPGATQMYVHCVRNGTGRIDFIASDMHPDNDTGGTSLYHFYAEWVSGSLKWYNSSGTEQTLPMTTSNATLLYDGSGGNDGWNWQIAIDGSGYPRVLFQKRVSTSGTGDNRLMFMKWSGSAWSTPVEITPLGGYVYSGQLSYTGGACFDGSDIDIVYLGKEVSSVYEIQKWATSDSGATWAKVEDITSGSNFVNMRPFSPLGHQGRMACLWTSGDYVSFTSYHMAINCHPPITNESYVKVPSVSDSSDTEIYVYYDNSAAAAQEDVANTWNSGFMVVYHMAEYSGSLNVTDSTSNSYNGTKAGLLIPYQSEGGSIGNNDQLTFDGASGTYVTTPSGINFAGLSGVTVEAVVKHDGSGASGDEHQIWSNWQSPSTTANMMMRIEPTAGTNSNKLEIYAIKQTDTQVGGDSGLTVAPNTSHHIAAVYDTTNLRGYVNGSVGGTTFSTGGAMDAGASLAGRIGNTPHTTSEGLTGSVEELRISNIARSAAWLKATYVNLFTPSTFYTLGTEEVEATGVTGTGAATTGNTTASGTGTLTHKGTGALTTLAATLAGTGVIGHIGTGDLTTGNVTVDGTGNVTQAGQISGTGVLTIGVTTVSGTGTITHVGTGALQTSVVTLDGAGVLSHTGTGALTTSVTEVSGTGSTLGTITGIGALTIGAVTVSGYDVLPSAVVGGGIGHGGIARRKPRLIRVEEAESPEEVIAEIEQMFAESVKKPGRKPKTVKSVEKPLQEPAVEPNRWIDYYQAQAQQLKQEQAMNDLLAQAKLKIKALQEQETLKRLQAYQQMVREEEEMMLLLMAA